MPNGEILAAMTLEANFTLPQIKAISEYLGIEHKYRTRNDWIKLGAKKLQGYQLRYIYFLNPQAKERLTCPIIPFSKIDEMGAGMYKGEKISLQNRRVKEQS